MHVKLRNKERLLLHTCCAPCSPHVIEILQREFEVSAFFYNPNIHPIEEYRRRLDEMERFCKKVSVELMVGDYDTDQWFYIAKGLEDEKEGDKRCELCYQMRMEKAACVAQTNSFQHFTTTLTLVPTRKLWSLTRLDMSCRRNIP
ncbi:MAG: epoxyqueuosine reductase QueH [Deltaproteobacteria bacterium]|nr:epoxyqueuosine reductase QueH [Deltaproteobacteria bacterium]